VEGQGTASFAAIVSDPATTTYASSEGETCKPEQTNGTKRAE